MIQRDTEPLVRALGERSFHRQGKAHGNLRSTARSTDGGAVSPWGCDAIYLKAELSNDEDIQKRRLFDITLTNDRCSIQSGGRSDMLVQKFVATFRMSSTTANCGDNQKLGLQRLDTWGSLQRSRSSGVCQDPRGSAPSSFIHSQAHRHQGWIAKSKGNVPEAQMTTLQASRSLRRDMQGFYLQGTGGKHAQFIHAIHLPL